MWILQTSKVVCLQTHDKVWCFARRFPKPWHFANEVFVYLFFIAFTVFAVPRAKMAGTPSFFGAVIRVGPESGIRRVAWCLKQVFPDLFPKISRCQGTSLLHNLSKLSDSWKNQELLIDQICWYVAEFGMILYHHSSNRACLDAPSCCEHWGLERFSDGTSFRVSWGLAQTVWWSKSFWWGCLAA